MQLSLQNFTSLVQGMASTVQAAASQVLDLSVGSTLRAILESSASIALWMQWLILQVLQMTRAATSNGPDLDSWMADFSLNRLQATSASGIVTFSRFTPTAEALVPIGALVRTVDGSQTFAVVAGSNAAGWNSVLSGYVLNASVGSLDIPVVAQTPGTSGNVQAGTIIVLAAAIAGIDTVSNALDFQNGINAESDSAFRLRFQGYLSSLSRATIGAVENAISSVQQGLTYTLQENANFSGAFQLGNFVITVDDGSGYPSNSLLAAVQAAVDAVRPVASTFAVFPPTVTEVNVTLAVTTSPSSSVGVVAPLITDAITSYVDSLSVAAALPASRIVQLAYGASRDVVNVTQVLLNGTPADLNIATFGVLKAGTVVIS